MHNVLIMFACVVFLAAFLAMVPVLGNGRHGPSPVIRLCTIMLALATSGALLFAADHTAAPPRGGRFTDAISRNLETAANWLPVLLIAAAAIAFVAAMLYGSSARTRGPGAGTNADPLHGLTVPDDPRDLTHPDDDTKPDR